MKKTERDIAKQMIDAEQNDKNSTARQASPVQLAIEHNRTSLANQVPQDVWRKILRLEPIEEIEDNEEIEEILNFRLTTKYFETIVNGSLNKIINRWNLNEVGQLFKLTELNIAKLQVHMRNKLPNLKHPKNLNTFSLEENYAFAYRNIRSMELNNLQRSEPSPPWYLSHCEMHRVTINNCSLPKSQFISSYINQCNFFATDITHSQFYGAMINQGSFLNVSFQYNNWNNVYINSLKSQNIDFSYSNLFFLTVNNATLNHVKMHNCTIQDSTFNNVMMLHGQLTDCLLSSVTFQRCNLNGTSFASCTLSDVRFIDCTMDNGISVQLEEYPLVTDLGLDVVNKAPSPTRSSDENLLEIHQQHLSPQPDGRLMADNSSRHSPELLRLYPTPAVRPRFANRRSPDLLRRHPSQPILRNRRQRPLPTLPDIDIADAYAIWSIGEIGHPSVRIQESSPLITKFCQKAYRSSADDSAKLLYFICRERLPLLCELSYFPEHQHLSDNIYADISQLLLRINPLLRYFVLDILKNSLKQMNDPQCDFFMPELVHNPDYNAMRTGSLLNMLKENPICMPLVDRSNLVSSSEFRAAFNGIRAEFTDEELDELESMFSHDANEIQITNRRL